jgi:hypothetical protein
VNEPQVTPGEWLAIAVTSGVAGIAGAMSWFGKAKRELQLRMAQIDGPDGRMAVYESQHASLDKQIAIIETCQENTAETLHELKGLHADMNKKLDDVLKEIRRK